MKFKLAVTYEACGFIEVDADTLEEAMDMVSSDPDNYPLPATSDYIDGSFALCTYDVEEMKALCNIK